MNCKSKEIKNRSCVKRMNFGFTDEEFKNSKYFRKLFEEKTQELIKTDINFFLFEKE